MPPPDVHDRHAPEAPSSRGRWPARLVLAALSTLIVIAITVVALRSGRPAAGELVPGTGAEALALMIDRATQRTSANTVGLEGLAVRPLAHGEGDAEAAALAGGVCDAVVHRLARLPQLRVTPCSSTRVAAAAPLDDAELARLVAARWVVRGELASRPAGRVQVRLVLRDMQQQGRNAWQMDEELDFGGLQQLPQRLAQAASSAFGQPNAGAETPLIAPELYARHLRAVQLARVPDGAKREDALRLTDEVLAAEPGYGPALYMRLALRITGVGAPREPAEARRAHDDALTAELGTLGARLLREDPGNGRAHILLLNHAFKQRRWIDVFAQADAMLEHARRQPFVLRIAARVHLYAGYVRRARELALEAVRLDALDADSMEALALVHGVLGDDVRAREFATLARQLGHRGTGLVDMVLARRSGDAAALEAAARGWAAFTGHPDAWVPDFVRAVTQPGEGAAARAAFDAVGEAARHGMVDYFVERALVGDVDGSARALREHALAPPARWVEQLWWPELAPVRRDPRFAQVLQALALPALWQGRGVPDLCTPDGDGQWRCR